MLLAKSRPSENRPGKMNSSGGEMREEERHKERMKGKRQQWVLWRLQWRAGVYDRAKRKRGYERGKKVTHNMSKLTGDGLGTNRWGRDRINVEEWKRSESWKKTEKQTQDAKQSNIKAQYGTSKCRLTERVGGEEAFYEPTKKKKLFAWS